MLGALRSFLTTKTPAAQLDEIRKRLAAATAEVSRLDEEIGRRAMPIMRGDAEAERAETELKKQKAQLETDIARLRAGEATLARAIADEAEAKRRAAAAALPRDIAADRAALLALDEEIDRLAEQLSARISQRIEAGFVLAERVGSEALRRANLMAHSRVRSQIAHLFMINRGQPNTEANNLLQLRSGEVGARFWMTLRQADEELVDDEAPFFATEAEAGAAKARLAARGSAVVVQEIGKAWTLTRHDAMFATRREAEGAVAMAARAGRKLAILAHGPGFIVRPERFADDAVIAPAGEAA